MILKNVSSVPTPSFSKMIRLQDMVIDDREIKSILYLGIKIKEADETKTKETGRTVDTLV